MVETCWNHSFMTSCRFFLCHSRYFSYSFLVSTSTQSWRSEGPQGPKARPLGTPSLVQTGNKHLQKWVFSRDFTGEMFDFQRCLSLFMFLFYFLLQNRWLGFPKKMEEAKVRFFFFEQHPAAEAQALNNCLNTANRWVALRKKTRCNESQWDDPTEPHWIWSSPIETWSSFQCTVTNDMLLHAEMQKCIMSWWPILSRILLLDICLEMWSCKLRYARKGMSKGETNVCTSPKWAAKVESLSMLNPNRQAVRAEYNVDWAKKCGTRWDRQPLGPVVF